MNEMKNGTVTSEAAMIDRTAVCDLNDEFTLPDYMPPIGRVISAEGCAAPPSRYIGGGSAEFAGAVRYRLLYEALPDSGGETGTGSTESAPPADLWCAELVSEYDTQFPLEKSAADGGEFAPDLSGAVSLAFADAENVTARVTAPRRVFLRSRVRVRARLLGQKTCTCLVRGSAPEDSVRLLGGSVRTGMTVSGMSEPVVLHETVPSAELPGGVGELRVVSCRGSVFVSDASLSGVGASCRGEVTVEMLLCRDGEGNRPFPLTRRIPLNAEVPFEKGCPEGWTSAGVCAWGKCTAASASVGEDGIVCEVSAVLCARTGAAGGAEYIRDVYSCVCSSETAVREMKMTHPAALFNTNITVSGADAAELPGGAASVRITDAHAAVLPDSVSAEADGEGRIRAAGALRVSVILDDGTAFSNREFEIPFRYAGTVAELGAGGDGAEPEVSAEVTAVGCRAHTEGDRLYCDCELSLALAVGEVCRIRAVSEVNFTSPRRSGDDGALTVCYPTPDDTLWSVAKRYGTDAAALAAANGLDPAQPEARPLAAGQRYLIVH